MLMHFLPYLRGAIIEGVTIENLGLLLPDIVLGGPFKKSFVLDIRVTFCRRSHGGDTDKEPCNVEMQAMRQRWL